MVALGLCCYAQLSLVVEHRLQVSGLQWLCMGLVALQHVKFPGQGIKPMSPNWQVDSYPLYHHGSPSLWVCLCLIHKSICVIFLDSTCKWCHMVFVFVWLTSLNMIISISVHGAAHGIISFFFIAE